MDINKRVLCVRAGQFKTAPRHTWTTVNWVGGEPRLACCVCDNCQQAINTRATRCFLLQPMQMGHTGSQCFDEGDRGNWADHWFHGTRVGTRVGHTGPGYPSTRVLTSLTITISYQPVTPVGLDSSAADAETKSKCKISRTGQTF